MIRIQEPKDHTDAEGNVIECPGGEFMGPFEVRFRGRRNRLLIHPRARIRHLRVVFDCDDGICSIGPNQGVAALQAVIRVGADSRVTIGDDVSTTNPVQISAVEGTEVSIGDDVMIAGSVKIRGDDGHPIFDVSTGKRVNPAQNILIGDHVWLGIESMILGGATIGDGSVVGARALVKGTFPNNCVIAGIPARLIRRDIAWERPHLSATTPPYKPDASTVETTAYWRLTEDLL